MDAKTWWIIIGIVIVLAILVLITIAMNKRRQKAHREEAHQLRQQAKEGEPVVAEAQERAETAEQRAQRARAEADAKQQEAEKLESEAKYEKETAAAVERDHENTLRRADALDPDTPTDRQGNRVEGTADTAGRHGRSAVDPATGVPAEDVTRRPNVDESEPRDSVPDAGAEQPSTSGEYGEDSDDSQNTVTSEQSVPAQTVRPSTAPQPADDSARPIRTGEQPPSATVSGGATAAGATAVSGSATPDDSADTPATLNTVDQDQEHAAPEDGGTR